ncbi:isoamylase early set domain-containing protein [Candidatus Saganbacteria bacterium]|uniref:Isoamylase early set domain-containing protein n=1 Tax=Candidatus Saganbacteria bacterium TaxID=2575572 RepID=A0A9D6UL41_UNCSA|nr:isoamylase early set domain-containing protein [Candidatus Saganbacteria bacterium]
MMAKILGKKKVVFKFQAPVPVQEVKLCGSFTNWEEGAIVMTRGKSGEWKAQVSLEPGEYEYRYRADNAWFNDPLADRQISNNYGSKNSVREVK